MTDQLEPMLDEAVTRRRRITIALARVVLMGAVVWMVVSLWVHGRVSTSLSLVVMSAATVLGYIGARRRRRGWRAVYVAICLSMMGYLIFDRHIRSRTGTPIELPHPSGAADQTTRSP